MWWEDEPFYFDTSQTPVGGPQDEVKSITLKEKQNGNDIMMIMMLINFSDDV